MSTNDTHHPDVDEEANALLARAYALDNDADTHALYSDWAETYDKTMLAGLGYLTPSKTAQLLHDHLEGRQSLVLDVGSGTGLAGAALTGLGDYTIDGLDYSAAMLEVARHRGVYRELIEADLNRPLDLADNNYDALICTGTFTHGHVGANCLTELFRILNKGGVFACTIHRDIWVPGGFAETSAAMEKSGRLKTLYHALGKYYSKSSAPEGLYIVWQKT